MRVLVTGASGYIGGRLIPQLLARGHSVVAGARSPEKLEGRPWREDVEVARLDVQDLESLHAAFRGVDAVYHLVHSMDGGEDFRGRDRAAATNVRQAAAGAGLRRIVYLGGLGRGSDDLSPHLRSRHEVGEVLAAGPVPVTELRAAVIIGSGSASFEMLRNLTEVLPVMVTPRWVETRCQPIAIADVLAYLCDVLEADATAGRVLEIGGPDVVTYREMMQLYADVAGLGRRLVLPVPVLSPELSSLWVGLVTPLPTGLARPLVGSLVNEVVVDDPTAQRLLPRELLPVRRAIELALARVQDLDVATTWASSRAEPRRPDPDPEGRPEDPHPADPSWSGGRVLAIEQRVAVAAPAAAAFDRLLHAEAALRDVDAAHVDDRSARHVAAPPRAEVSGSGPATQLDAPTLLRLRVPTRMPGEAWHELRFTDDSPGCWLEVRLRYHPRGLWGLVAWFLSTPLHRAALRRMAWRMARRAETGGPVRTSDV